MWRARSLALMLCLSGGYGLAPSDAQEPQLVIDVGGHTNSAIYLFTPDGSRLVSASRDKTIRIWDAKAGESLTVLRPPIGPGLAGMLSAGALSRDGKTLYVAGQGLGRVGPGAKAFLLYQIDLDTGRLERAVPAHDQFVNSLALSPNGQYLASGSEDNVVRVWNLATWKAELVLEGHQRGVWEVAWAPDGKSLATAATDGARIWSFPQGQQRAQVRDPHTDGRVYLTRTVAWSPDGRTLAVGGADRTIRLLNADGTIRHRIRDVKLFAADNWVRGLAFLRDGKRLLYNGSILDLDSETVRVAVDGKVSFLSPDDSLAVSLGNANEAFLWSTVTGKVLAKLEGKARPPVSVGFGPDGTSIGWGYRGDPAWFNERHPIEHAFDLTTLEPATKPGGAFQQAFNSRGSLSLAFNRKSTNLEVLSGGVRQAEFAGVYLNPFRCWSFLPGTEQVITGLNQDIHAYDLRNGGMVRKWEGVWNTHAVSPSFDGRYFLTASGDHVIRLWRPDTNPPLLHLLFAENEWIVWTPEGYYAASPGGERLMGWQINNGPSQMATFIPASQFRASLYRPDVVKLVLKTGNVQKALERANELKGKETARVEVTQVLPPLVLITTPDKVKSDATSPRVEIRALAKAFGKHPISSMRLLVNGRPHVGPEAVKSYQPPRSGEVRESWTIELAPGVNTVVVQADCGVSKGLSESVEIAVGARGAVRVDKTQTPEKWELPNLYVLAIGVSDYPKDSLKLRFAAKDAQVLAKTLQGVSGPLFNKIEVKLLVDRDATLRNIRQGLSWLKKQMTQRDVAMVFFAGHGEQDNAGVFYLLPSDVDPDDVSSTALSSGLLRESLQSVPGRVILMLDACHSGSVEGRRSAASMSDDLRRDLVSDECGVVVMCSSTGKEYSLESQEVEHGMFTKALVEGVSGEADYNKDGTIYFNELDLYVSERVKSLSRGRQHPVTNRPASVRPFPLSRSAGRSSP